MAMITPIHGTNDDDMEKYHVLKSSQPNQIRIYCHHKILMFGNLESRLG